MLWTPSPPRATSFDGWAARFQRPNRRRGAVALPGKAKCKCCVRPCTHCGATTAALFQVDLHLSLCTPACINADDIQHGTLDGSYVLHQHDSSLCRWQLYIPDVVTINQYENNDCTGAILFSYLAALKIVLSLSSPNSTMLVSAVTLDGVGEPPFVNETGTKVIFFQNISAFWTSGTPCIGANAVTGLTNNALTTNCCGGFVGGTKRAATGTFPACDGTVDITPLA